MKYHRYSLHLISIFLLCFSTFLYAEEEKPITTQCVEGKLTFASALQRVFRSAPGLAQSAIEYDISAAKTCQASLLPNPEFSVYADDIGGDADDDCCSDSEVTCSVIQLIELGGKRCARRSLAERLEDVVLANQEIVKQNLCLDTAEAFIEAYAAQEELSLAKRQKELREQIHHVVVAKVEAGKVSLTHQNRMGIAVARAGHIIDRAERFFLLKKHQLAALWCDPCPTFVELEFPFYDIAPPPPLCQLLPGIYSNPDLLKFEVEIAAAEDNLALQKTYSMPDITIEAGVVDNRHNEETQMSFGFSIPLPFFDRNQGNIAASDCEINLLENKRDAMICRLEAELAACHQEWLGVFNEVTNLRETILKKAKESADLVHEGYRQGKFELLEVLDSDQVVVDVEKSFLDALVEFHKCKAKVERLIGRAIQ